MRSTDGEILLLDRLCLDQVLMDRQPCQTCVHRGEGQSCSYESQKESSVHTMRLEGVNTDNQVLKERIRRLEKIVQSHAYKSDSPSITESLSDDNTTQASVASEDESNRETLGPGVLSGNLIEPGGDVKHQGRYKSLTSWDSILRELDEVKVAVNDHAFDPAHPNEGQNLQKSIHSNGPFFAAGQENLSDLFKYLPPQTRMDLLIDQYFQSYHPFYPIIDPVTFRWHYQTFLVTLDDFVMLSQIFGMMALAVVNGDPDDPTSDEYARLALRALQASEFMTKFTVSSVVCMVNIMFFYQRERFQQTFTWIMFGFALQMARALGLHRDPTHFSITGQECQTRRHVWVALLTHDAIHSARYGRTTIIDVEEWDTKAPEESFTVNSAGSCPLPTSYSYTKRVIAISIAKLFRLLFRPRACPSYQMILDVERDLRVIHAGLPQYMKSDLSKSMSDYKVIQWLFCRFSPFILAHSMIVIHRPFLLRKSEEFHHSRITCLQAAREMIEIVCEMENAPGLEQYAWHVRELRNIAYLPAATLLCIGLHIRAHADFTPLPLHAPVADASSDCQLIERILDSLPMESHAYSVIGQLYSQVKSPSSSRTHVAPENRGSLSTESPQHRDLTAGDNLVGGPQNEWNIFAANPGAFGGVDLPFALSQQDLAREVPAFAIQPDLPSPLDYISWQQAPCGLTDQSGINVQRSYDPLTAYWNEMDRRGTGYNS